MIHFARNLQKKYPYKNIKIYSNFNLKGQDGKVTEWSQILDLPPCTILLLDEAQSTWTSTKNFSAMDPSLLWKLTQCRKKELMVLYTSPVFHRMDIKFRENTDKIVVCKNRFKMSRWFTYEFYEATEYERYIESPVKLFVARKFNINLIAKNSLFANYDTTQTVDRFDIIDENKKAPSKFDVKRLKDEILKELQHKMQAK